MDQTIHFSEKAKMAECVAIIAKEAPFLNHSHCANLVLDAYGFQTSDILERVSRDAVITEAKKMIEEYRRVLALSTSTDNPHKDHVFAVFEDDGMMHVLFTRFIPTFDTQLSFFQNSKGGIAVIVDCNPAEIRMRFFCRSYDRTGRYPRAEGKLEPGGVIQLFDEAWDRFAASTNRMSKYLLGDSLIIAESDWSPFSVAPVICSNPLRAFLEG